MATVKPNILVIMGDDIDWFNPSIYHRGMMGYKTPNIDRIGNALRTPRGFNLRADPFERGDESGAPLEGFTQLYFVVPAQAVVAKWLETFKEFPPRQAPASFNVNDVVEKLTAAASGGR